MSRHIKYDEYIAWMERVKNSGLLGDVALSKLSDYLSCELT